MSSSMPDLDFLRVKLFADGADIDGIRAMYARPEIKGFTTNPTLMRKAGQTNYKAFAQEVLHTVPDRPISFEVLADEFNEMEQQAREIASWGINVNVKIPITNSRGESSVPLIQRLSDSGIAVNVTAMFTSAQVEAVIEVASPKVPVILSIFAGRIADTGRDPMPLMRQAVDIARAKPLAEVLWASPRELLNIFQADEVACHIITATSDVLAKLTSVGKDLDEFSRETVEMFRRDAVAAAYEIPLTAPRAAE